MTAFVFNCAFNGLAIIRELGRHGVPVYALDVHRTSGTFSRYATYRRSPNPQVAEDAFIELLLQMGRGFDEKPVLFPTNDEWAVALARHKDVLSELFVPCVADWPTIQLVVEKQRFYQWGLTNNVPVPRSWYSSEADNIPDDAFPLAAKPEYRRIASNEAITGQRAKFFDSHRLTLLNTRAELTQFMNQHKTLLPFILLQEYVAGLSDCMYTVGVYANRHHEILGLFSGRKLRGFPPDVGDCMVGQIEAVPVQLKELVKLVCKEIKYHGIAEFEFKRDVHTGEFKLIEINPRSWSWVGITPACGVSLPWIAYCDLIGQYNGDYIESKLSNGSVKWVRIFDDLINCLYANRRAGYPQWHMTPRQWWRSLHADQLVLAEFTADDPMPGIPRINALALQGMVRFNR